MGYEELNSHYESLNKKSIEKYNNNSYQKYLDNHEKNIGNKFPPIPEYNFNEIKASEKEENNFDFER